LSATVLILALVISAPRDSVPVLHARRTAVPPVIDGRLEEVWQSADSATGFIQQTPENGKPATEKTTAYLLYDENNIYVAFRCEVQDITRVRDRLSEEPDVVRLMIDTFDDRTSCYLFVVGFNGVESDYRLTGDGSAVENWDGVWWSAVQKYNWGYGVEMVIPFRSLRYRQDGREWRVDFARYVLSRGERSFWSRHEVTGFKVSNMGRLTGIIPPGRQLGLEIYPVGLVRHEKLGSDFCGWQDLVRAEAGLDLAYAPTPSASLQLTLLPDFAQIEADPYQVNLSRYELWLSERRPFFIEAAETFGGSDQPVKIFYSRRIGRPLPDGRVVPILTGVKWTDRFGKSRYGILGAVTGAVAAEPQSYYSVLALRHQVLTNSELGLIYAGKDNALYSNHGVGLDAVFRSRWFTSRLFTAGSQFGESLDYALSLEGGYESDIFTGSFTLRQIQPRFNMNGPGYTTWRGQYANFYAGPVVYNRGPFRYGAVYPGIEIRREWNYPPGTLTAAGFVNSSAVFKNQQHLTVWGGYGQDWALAKRFCYGYAGCYFATDYSRPFSLSLYTNYYTRTANYRLGMIAPVYQAQLNLQQRLSDRLSVWFGDEITVEQDSLRRLDLRQGLTSVLRSGMEYRFTARAAVRLALETVSAYDPAADRRSVQNSLFGLYSWTFAPRSTFYFASNWSWTDSSVRTIFVAKVRYLFNI
jgi:hypothetical protein